MKSYISYTKPISAPIIKNEEYGKLIIEIDGRNNIEIPLLAEKSISQINPIGRIFAAIKYLIFGTSLDEN